MLSASGVSYGDLVNMLAIDPVTGESFGDLLRRLEAHGLSYMARLRLVASLGRLACSQPLLDAIEEWCCVAAESNGPFDLSVAIQVTTDKAGYNMVAFCEMIATHVSPDILLRHYQAG